MSAPALNGGCSGRPVGAQAPVAAVEEWEAALTNTAEATQQNGERLAAPPGSANEFRKLVDDFANAALRAGQSNSGYVIDVMAPHQWDAMQKLRARLHALAPMFDSPNGGLSDERQAP